MTHEERVALMQALEQARILVNERRQEVAPGNEYAWQRLHRIANYLCSEQVRLGQEMFRDPEAAEALPVEAVF